MTEYLLPWDSSSFIDISTIEDCSESLKEVGGDCVFYFTDSYHHPMNQVMSTSCSSLNHWMYLNKTYEVLSNPYTLDSGPAVAPTFHDCPVVLDEDDNNTVSTLDEDNNNKHVRKIKN